jgi:hypothetical protein
VKQPSGAGIGDVTVRLFNDANLDGLSDGGTPVRVTNTTASGTFSMVNLTPGPYVLVETQPSGYTSLYELDETNDNDTLVTNNLPNDNVIPVTVEPQEIDADNVFVEVANPGDISGYVFEDLNNNNIPDAGEGIPGVILTVYADLNANGVADPGGFVDTAITNSSGFYIILDLDPTNYVIFETQPAGFNSISDIDVSNDNDVVPNTNTMNDTIPFTIGIDELDEGNYFKEVIACTNMVENTNDSGPGSLRYVLECADSGDTIVFSTALQNQTIHLTSTWIDINKNIYIHSSLASPRIMIYSDVPGAFKISSGYTVEMKNIEITSGITGQQGAAIENYGNLTLWDVSVHRNPLLPTTNYLIYNTGTAQLILKGACDLQPD